MEEKLLCYLEQINAASYLQFSVLVKDKERNRHIVHLFTVVQCQTQERVEIASRIISEGKEASWDQVSRTVLLLLLLRMNVIATL